MIPYNELTDENKQKSMVDSEDVNDRIVSAYKGRGLDKLVYDSDPYVLRAVAGQLYGLDKLANDPHEEVQAAVEYVLEEYCYSQTLEEWIAANPDRCALPKNRETGEAIRTPRGMFYVTDMSRSQLEAAGYGFHHESDDGDYLIMGNGTQAFAIPANQTSPEQSQKAKTVDIPKAKTQADAATTLNQDATTLTTPTKEQTQQTKQVR